MESVLSPLKKGTKEYLLKVVRVASPRVMGVVGGVFMPRRRTDARVCCPLAQTVVPTIVEGFTQLAVDRPTDPHLWLAEFLLSRSPQGAMYEIRRL